jgi:hypothetical protein
MHAVRYPPSTKPYAVPDCSKINAHFAKPYRQHRWANELPNDRFTVVIAKTAPTAVFFRMDENS